MPVTETNPLLASLLNQRIEDYLKENISNVSMTVWDNDLTSNSVLTNGGGKDSYITTMLSDESSEDWSTGWAFTKHESNPLIAIEYAASQREAYPPCVRKDGDD